MKERATALSNSTLVEQLCDAVTSKLIQHFESQLPSKQWAVGSSPARDATKLARATAFPLGVTTSNVTCASQGVGYQQRQGKVATLSDALVACRICAKAEGKSPRTIQWITSSVSYFRQFLGGDQDIAQITADDLRRFIIALQESPKYRKHPFNRPQQEKLSPQTVHNYARGIRAFFGYLHRESLIDQNPMQKVRMPRVPTKIVPTFSETEIERLLSQPNRHTDRGFRDYTLILTFIDTGARLSEIVNLKAEDVDLDNGYLKVMGKGSKERYIPFGQKVTRAFFFCELNHQSILKLHAPGVVVYFDYLDTIHPGQSPLKSLPSGLGIMPLRDRFHPLSKIPCCECSLTCWVRLQGLDILRAWISLERLVMGIPLAICLWHFRT